MTHYGILISNPLWWVLLLLAELGKNPIAMIGMTASNIYFATFIPNILKTKRPVWYIRKSYFWTTLISSLILVSEVFLNVLENAINSLITELINDDRNHNAGRLYFQQNGASPGHVVAIRKFLSTRFPVQ